MFNFFPFSYTFKSRLVTVSERISWLIIYPFFLFLVVFLFDGSYIQFSLYFLSTLSAYEVGYLFNDFVTVRNESNPTVRCKSNSDFFYVNFKSAVFSRVLIAYSVSLVIYFIYDSLLSFLIVSFVFFVYYFHNSIRSRFNVLTYICLVSLRYIGPVVFLNSMPIFFMIFMCFPLCRTIEHACKPKYGFSKLRARVGGFDKFRVFYYSFLLFLTLFVIYFFDVNCFFSMMAAYFFTYRGLAFLVRNKVSRQSHSSYK